MTEREKLLMQIRANKFAQWELHIFLDTHPDHREAAARLKEYNHRNMELVRKYEELYGPLNEASANTNRLSWVNDPWPWELSEEDDS